MVISAAQNGEATDYTYGLERISASTKNSRTEFVYDGRRSVIGEVTKAGLLSTAKVMTKSYTPFGEQTGEKASGFGWNGEYYNTTTGQVYLRARFYEPEMNRFAQKDIVRGSVISTTSLNRYPYCGNDPINRIDPSGATWKSAISKAANKVVSTVSNAVNNFIADPVGTAAKAANAVINAASHPVNTAVNAVKSVAGAVTSFVSEVRAPASTQPARTTYTPVSGGYIESGAASNGNASYSGRPKTITTQSPYVTAPNQNSNYACNPQENSTPSTFGSYLLQSLKSFVLGDYSSADPTWLSLGLNIVAGFANVDIGLDLRDGIYDITHTEELEHPVGRIALDVLALLPIIGAVKYIGKGADVVKQADKALDAIDDISDVTKQVDKIGDWLFGWLTSFTTKSANKFAHNT